MGSSFWRALAAHQPPVPGPGPYGTLLPSNEHGLRLPAGFTSRIVARGNEEITGTRYRWHFYPDGSSTFPQPDGGWILVSNSEVISRGGGASAIVFAADGTITRAYRILDRTSFNCAGGRTPWGTWLSCEEVDAGHVWECDPTGARLAVMHRALGTFKHEAAVVDPQTGRIYLTEDEGDSGFYRFTPAAGPLPIPALPQPFPSPLLRDGVLEVAQVGATGTVTWLRVPEPNPAAAGETMIGTPTRHQLPAMTRFERGEGAWFDEAARVVFFSTTTDHRIWAYHVDAATIEVYFDGAATPGSPLRKPDNLTVSRAGDIFVCEDGDDMQIVILAGTEIAPFLQVTGPSHSGSEVTGVTFNPAGNRLYFSSQRGANAGITFEVRGPFRASA